MIHGKKEAIEGIKAQHNELNKCAKKHSGAFAMHGKELIKEHPDVVRIDGIRAKETKDTVFGVKIEK